MNLAISTDFTLDAVFESMASLPVFPKIVHEALKVLDDPKKKISDVSEIIKYDQGLVGNILKLTNSALFGLTQQVSDLDTALALLGQRRIREVLITSAALPYLSRTLSGYQMSPQDLWLHSVGCAIISEAVSEKVAPNLSSELYTAAILHDIGKIVLDIYLGPRLIEVLEHARIKEHDFSMAEWEIIGTDHAIAGSTILKNWDFPPDIYRAVRNHHDPDLYIQEKLSTMLALSNLIAVQLGLGVGADGFRYRINPEILKKLELSTENYLELIDEAVKKIDAAQDVFKLILE